MSDPIADLILKKPMSIAYEYGYVDELAKLIRQHVEEERQQWVSVYDYLPSMHKNCYGYFSDEPVFQTDGAQIVESLLFINLKGEIWHLNKAVAYWMPRQSLPQPPQDKQENK